VITTGCEVLGGVAAGLEDTNVDVRSRCIQTVLQTGQALGGQVLSADEVRYRFRHDYQPLGNERVAKLSVEINRDLQPLAGALAQGIKRVQPTLADTDASVCIAAAGAVEAAADAANKFQEQEGDVAVLRNALRGVVHDLAKLLSHQDERVRLAAVYAFESLRLDAGPAVEALVVALHDRDSFVRWGAARTLAKMAPAESKKAVAGLVSAIKDPNGDVRVTALVALGRFGPAAVPVVGALTEALKGSEVETRILAAQALEAVGREAAASVPALVDALTSPEAKLRIASARALGRIGPDANAVVGPLQKALSDPDGDVRLAASEALLLIGQKK
jgi:HEAT repeat protein